MVLITFAKKYTMRLIWMFVLAVALTACNEADKKAAGDVSTTAANTPVAATAETPAIDSSTFTTISWDTIEKDFGKMKEGEKLEAKFVFKNTGNKPLIIQNARASCGCTVAEYTKEPVAPGASGEVKGVFDSQGKPGHQKKSIYVTANTKGTMSHELNFSVEVIKKP
jgi:hypothetical protein